MINIAIIKKRRKELKMTRLELALVLNISVCYYGKIENGRVDVGIGRYEAICKVLGLKIITIRSEDLEL